ncbi:hypothetical protein CASFOL_005146 [Castilleja foliolosa]|uniref:C2H2-type domain-containing protein n=1 Tax=Castilleja foliolosa TaxID=1961234 RepID=A0ABD3E2K4_9LAMI
MARSWDELSPDHKFVHLLESVVQKQDQRTPIACRVCDEIHFDTKSLMIHFQSHLHPNGTFNPNTVQENKINLFSTSSQYIHSFPVNGRNHMANVNIVSSRQATLSFRDSLVSTPSRNHVQLSGPPLNYRHQPYPSPLIFRSPKPHVPVNPVTEGDSARGKRPLMAMENKVEGPLACVTRPFVKQLEKPIGEMAAGVIDVDADELDLTLKL